MAFWHPLLLRHLGAQRRLLLYDQRGHGYSNMPSSGYTSLDMAEDARAILDAHDFDVVDVMAHSFGAGVALQLARIYPARVNSLTILDGRIRAIQALVRLRDWVHFPRWSRQCEEAGIVVDPDWEVDCTLPLRLQSSDLTRVAEEFDAHGFFVPNVQNRAATKYRRLLTETSALADFEDPAGLTSESLTGVRQPTLLLYGTMSPFVECGRELLTQLPQAQFEIVDGGGHNFPFTRPGKTWDALRRWDVLDLEYPFDGSQEN
jgi:pimeloyl-ACP methyl ester carboxylesterase